MTVTVEIADEAHQVGHVARLKSAGFAPISRAALAFARLRLVDAAKSHKRIMSRRDISLISFVASKKKSVGIELAVTTTEPEAERAAIKIIVRYFTFFGAEIEQTQECREFNLFADPIGKTEAQCFFCPPPAQACWVLVTTARQTDERRIGIYGSIRPRDLPTIKSPSLKEALAGRQRFWLAHYLAEAEKTDDRRTAMQVLSRMVFLERRTADLRQLRLVADIDQVISDLGEKDKPRVSNKQSGRQSYAKLYIAPFDNSLPLSRWLASEAISLKREFGKLLPSSEIIIPDGQNLGLRVLAANHAGYSVVIEKSAGEAGAKPDKIPWVKNEELLSFLTEA